MKGEDTYAIHKAYHDFVRSRTSETFNIRGVDARIIHAAFGASTEANELLDAVKKVVFYGTEPDYVNMDEEVGDLLFYIYMYFNARGRSLHNFLEQNAAKLEARYPNGFSMEHAVNRDLEVERSVLEGRKINSTATQIEGRTIYEPE